MTRLLSLTILAPPLTRSLGANNIGVNGASALAAVLKETQITTLKCAAASKCSFFVSAPIDTPPSLGSLARNQLCGVAVYGYGTYTAEGIPNLCEALKGSAVTSLKCAAAPRACLSVSAR